MTRSFAVLLLLATPAAADGPFIIGDQNCAEAQPCLQRFVTSYVIEPTLLQAGAIDSERHADGSSLTRVQCPVQIVARDGTVFLEIPCPK